MRKDNLRKEYLDKRTAMSVDEAERMSAIIKDRLMSSGVLQGTDTIFTYHAFRNEVKVQSFPEKIMAMPQVDQDGTMIFRQVNGDTVFRKSRFGVHEPDTGSCVKPTDSTVVLVPGACFSENGYRIGYGGGYYDRYLHTHPKGMTIGVCYDFQLREEVPVEDHDQPVDMIVTEKRIIDLRNKKRLS